MYKNCPACGKLLTPEEQKKIRCYACDPDNPLPKRD